MNYLPEIREGAIQEKKLRVKNGKKSFLKTTGKAGNSVLKKRAKKLWREYYAATKFISQI